MHALELHTTIHQVSVEPGRKCQVSWHMASNVTYLDTNNLSVFLRYLANNSTNSDQDTNTKEMGLVIINII